jgi:hypothetical protein
LRVYNELTETFVHIFLFCRGVVCVVTNTFEKMRLTAWHLKRESWKKDKEKIQTVIKSTDYQKKLVVNSTKQEILSTLRSIGYKNEGKKQ